MANESGVRIQLGGQHHIAVDCQLFGHLGISSVKFTSVRKQIYKSFLCVEAAISDFAQDFITQLHGIFRNELCLGIIALTLIVTSALPNPACFGSPFKTAQFFFKSITHCASFPCWSVTTREKTPFVLLIAACF